jgi:hypothetical protein
MTVLACSRRRLLIATCFVGLLPGSANAQQQQTIATTDQLDHALAQAEPGDEIILADGEYSAPKPITRGGTAEQPIVIRAANILGAVFTGGTFQIDADHVVVQGLDLVSCAVQVGEGARAANVRLWRCRVRNGSGFAIRLYTAPDFDAAYCEVSNWQGRGFGFSAAGSPRPAWRYSMFRDSVGSTSNNDGEAMHYSFGPPNVNAGGLVYRCKFKNWSYPDEEEIISVKCSGNIFRQITVENCGGQAVNNRFGKSNIYDAIWTDGAMGIGVHDGCGAEGNRVLGCRVDNPTGSSSGIMVRAGQHPPCSFDIGSNNAAAGECVVSGCIGTVQVGRTYSNSTQPARGTRIRQHTGSLIMGFETQTDSQPAIAETLYTWSPLIWLQDSNVGPLANL